MYRLFVFLTLFALVFTGCNPASSSTKADSAILTSTTFLADITQNIAGDRVTVESLLPIGADPHSYQPTPLDTAKIADSKMLIINGADYEHFLQTLFENAGGDRTIIETSTGVVQGKMRMALTHICGLIQIMSSSMWRTSVKD